VKFFKGEALMKPVEKTVVPNVELVSNLNYAQPLDRLEEPVAITSQLNYLKPGNSQIESNVFWEANGVVFQKMGKPSDLADVALSNVERLMK
jgi:hypothetical protein